MVFEFHRSALRVHSGSTFGVNKSPTKGPCSGHWSCQDRRDLHSQAIADGKAINLERWWRPGPNTRPSTLDWHNEHAVTHPSRPSHIQWEPTHTHTRHVSAVGGGPHRPNSHVTAWLRQTALHVPDRVGKFGREERHNLLEWTLQVHL